MPQDRIEHEALNLLLRRAQFVKRVVNLVRQNLVLPAHRDLHKHVVPRLRLHLELRLLHLQVDEVDALREWHQHAQPRLHNPVELAKPLHHTRGISPHRIQRLQHQNQQHHTHNRQHHQTKRSRTIHLELPSNPKLNSRPADITPTNGVPHDQREDVSPSFIVGSVPTPPQVPTITVQPTRRTLSWSSMPPRLERRQQTGDLHFITFSCHGRKPYLNSPRAAAIFEHSLESIRQKYHFQLLGYVVMPEHVHLLLSEPPTHPLSTVLGSLKRSVSETTS